VQAFLGVAVLLLASLLGIYTTIVVLLEIGDGPQYLYFGPFDHIRAWPVAAVLGVVAVGLVVLGGRLLRRQRNGLRAR
jgi:hypothetical protein